MTIASASSSRYDSAATAPMGMSMVMATQQSKRFSREYWQRELEALLRVHEPTQVHTSTDLLDAYEGMVRLASLSSSSSPSVSVSFDTNTDLYHVTGA